MREQRRHADCAAGRDCVVVVVGECFVPELPTDAVRDGVAETESVLHHGGEVGGLL